MTVIELIELLSKFPPGSRIYVGKGVGPLEGVDGSDPELIILRPEKSS